MMKYDVIIVGGSYAGLSAAMQLVRARKRTLVIDTGLPRNRFAKASHGFFGRDGQAPYTILNQAAQQLRAYPTLEMVQGDVFTARKIDDGFVAALSDGRQEHATRLILATGLRDELPDIPGLQERWGVTVLHCPYRHGFEFADRNLGVLASHPLSAPQATLIADWGPTTYFTQGVFEPDAEQTSRLNARGVKIERTPIAELLGKGLELDAVKLSDGRMVILNAIFITPKAKMASSLAEVLGCVLDDGPLGAYIRVDDWKQTTVAGVYAAGDITTFIHNATVASASGVLSGVSVHQSLVAVNS
jgi:thioredoxin reductase